MCIQFIVEVVTEVVCGLPFDYALKGKDEKQINKFALGIVAIVLGAILGGLSLLVWPHTFVASSNLRIVNLMLAPAISAVSAFQIAKARQGSGVKTSSLRHAVATGLFTFGLTAIRMAFGQH